MELFEIFQTRSVFEGGGGGGDGTGDKIEGVLCHEPPLLHFCACLQSSPVHVQIYTSTLRGHVHVAAVFGARCLILFLLHGI